MNRNYQHPPFSVPGRQDRVSNVCPFGCKPEMVLRALPPPNAMVPACSFCYVCLGRWKTDAEGEIVELFRVTSERVCPKCHVALLPGEHTCILKTERR